MGMKSPNHSMDNLSMRGASTDITNLQSQ